jgi:hypothetical protein
VTSLNKPLRRWTWITWVIIIFCFGCAPIASVPTPTLTQEIFPSPTSHIIATPTEEVMTVSEPTPSPSPVISPSPRPQVVTTPTVEVLTVSVHDPHIRTDLAEVDHIIDTVLEGDINEFRQRIKFTTSGCTHADGLGGPPKCREGESEGMLVEVLPFLGPEGHFLRRDEINEWQGIDVTGLYAVYRVSEEAFTNKDYPAGEYGIVFGTKMPHSIITLQVENGSILRIDSLFGTPPEINFERDAQEIILPPPS